MTCGPIPSQRFAVWITSIRGALVRRVVRLHRRPIQPRTVFRPLSPIPHNGFPPRHATALYWPQVHVPASVYSRCRCAACLSPARRVLLLTLEGKQIGSGDDLARLLTAQLGLTEIPAESKKTPRQHLIDQLQTIRPQPLFLFDEVAHLQAGDATLFPWLRALGQDQAAIVYAGSPLDWVRVVQRAAKVAPGSSFGNDVTPVKLGPIADSDALRFLVETSQ